MGWGCVWQAQAEKAGVHCLYGDNRECCPRVAVISRLKEFSRQLRAFIASREADLPEVEIHEYAELIDSANVTPPPLEADCR